MFKANISFEAYEDHYTDGQSLDSDNWWNQELIAGTLSELQSKVEESVYSKRADWNDEQINEYDWCTEYFTSYLADAENVGEASKQQIEAWKNNACKLWAINCHILLSEITETKATF